MGGGLKQEVAEKGYAIVEGALTPIPLIAL